MSQGICPRDSDPPNPDSPIWFSYRCLSRRPSLAATRPFKMDDPDPIFMISQLRMSRTPCLQNLRNAELRCSDILTVGPSMALPPSCQGFRLHDSEVQEYPVLRTSKRPILDSLQISATCLLKWTVLILPGTFTMEIPDLLSS
jgi:hypothetical protein